MKIKISEMKKIIKEYRTTCCFLILLFVSGAAISNNIQISNVSLTGQNTASDYTLVEFDISWENSWRVVGGPANWDAAWIFIKYRVGAGPWTHAFLNNTGHSSCAGTTITTGLLSPELVFDPATNPGLGVFLYRAVPGSGTFNCQNVQLRWNYGANALSDNEQVDIKVFAIEQVYVPEGAFKIGSGGIEAGAFYTYPTTTQPFDVTSEAAITIGTSAGNLYYAVTGGGSGDQVGPLPAGYPKGFKAFYVMKYEISQQGYVDFLNSLSRVQQGSRVRTVITGTSITNQFVMSNATTVNNRNGIWSFSTIPASPSPVIFFCNYDGDQTGNESNDGQSIACGYLYPQDLWAYLDWAALRPMTELEFEKTSRGPVIPVANEYAWGNTYIRNAQSYTNPGNIDEGVTDNYSNCSAGSLGPSRCGIYAKNTTDRTFSGATYYGAMEFSGNVLERAITVGRPAGRSFLGNHGNGELSAIGDSNESSWPGPAFFGGGSLRGGGAVDGAYQTSYRYYGATGQTSFAYFDGGRGVRTAPQ